MSCLAGRPFGPGGLKRAVSTLMRGVLTGGAEIRFWGGGCQGRFGGEGAAISSVGRTDPVLTSPTENRKRARDAKPALKGKTRPNGLRLS
jgi:hypothetical protein